MNIRFTSKDNKIIDIFKSTYNARYLRDFEGTTLKIKIDKIEKLRRILIETKENPVLVQLISNLLKYHFLKFPTVKKIKPVYDIENIEGPHYLTKLRLEEQDGKQQENPVIKTVYIYGEQHKQEVDIADSCPKPSTRFNKYLNLLRQTSPAFIDIYLEFPFSKAKHRLYSNEMIIVESYKNIIDKVRAGTKFSDINLFEEFRNTQKQVLQTLLVVPYDADVTDLYRSSSFMFEELEKDLRKCIAPQYDKSYCKIIRVHNIDMRKAVQNDTEINVIPVDYTTVFLCITYIFNLKRNLRPIKPITISNLIKLINNQFIVVDKDGNNVHLMRNLIHIMKTNPEGLIKTFQTSATIQKEYIQSYERNRIDEFFKQKCRSNSSDIISLGTILEKFLNVTDANSIPTTQETSLLNNKLIPIGAMIMDYYGLLRIFKEYLPRASDPLHHPLRSTNIIIYAGSAHSKVYSNFFQTIGFQPFFHYKNPNIKSIKGHCVNTKRPTVSIHTPIPPTPIPPTAISPTPIPTSTPVSKKRPLDIASDKRTWKK